VHLGIILVNDQLGAQFFFRICLFQISTCFEHSVLLIIRRINYINTASKYMSLYVGDLLVCRFFDTLSITIGMNLWFAPQISEHCTYRKPGRLIENLIWLRRPGVATVFTPNLGTVLECNISAAVTIIRIGEFIGSTTRLSVSSSRNVLIGWSSCCTIYKVKLEFCEIWIFITSISLVSDCF
jgi:hypothetical protein